MRVLILVNQFPPDVNATGNLMHELAKGLTRRGHQVHVITSFPHYAEFRITPEFRGRLIERSVEDGVDTTRLWVFASGQKGRMWHRLLNYLSYCGGAFLAAQANAAEYDVVLAPSGAFFTGATARGLQLLRGCPYVYNVQDVYPEVPLRAGQLSASWQVRGLEWIAHWMYRHAAVITVISEAQRELLMQQSVPANRIEIIPNFVNVDRVKPLPRDPAMVDAFGWQDRFVVMHSGNIGFAYDFDTLLEAAKGLQARRDVRIVIIGEGVRKAELQERARQQQLDNVQFLPFQPSADLPRLRACADLQLSLYKSGSSTYSLPSKLYEIMASGRPVIGSAEAGSGVARLIERADAGIRIDPENVHQLIDAINFLRDHPAEREHMGRRGRAYAVAHHSVDAAVDAYEQLLARVVRRH
jgi:colanic acid biosynthesis glycosyl transferase WcaI